MVTFQCYKLFRDPRCAGPSSCSEPRVGAVQYCTFGECATRASPARHASEIRIGGAPQWPQLPAPRPPYSYPAPDLVLEGFAIGYPNLTFGPRLGAIAGSPTISAPRAGPTLPDRGTPRDWLGIGWAQSVFRRSLPQPFLLPGSRVCRCSGATADQSPTEGHWKPKGNRGGHPVSKV